jgi:hypothetical protein
VNNGKSAPKKLQGLDFSARPSLLKRSARSSDIGEINENLAQKHAGLKTSAFPQKLSR